MFNQLGTWKSRVPGLFVAWSLVGLFIKASHIFFTVLFPPKIKKELFYTINVIREHITSSQSQEANYRLGVDRS